MTVFDGIKSVLARRALRAALRALSGGKTMHAVALFAAAAERAQADPKLLHNIRTSAGKNLLKAGAPREALSYLYAAAEYFPGDANNLRRLARAAYETNDATTEIFAWRGLLKCKPGDIKAHQRLAKLYYARESKKAEPHLEAVASISPDWTENWRRLARVRALKGDSRGESDAWARVLKNKPGDGEAHARLSELAWDPQRPARALAHLEALAASSPARGEFWGRLARARAAAGDRAGEVKAWRCFLRDSRYSFVAHRRIGAFMLTKGVAEKATPHLNAAAALAPDKGGVLKMCAAACRALDDREGEINVLSKLATMKLEDAPVARRLGVLLAERGRHAEAVDAFRRAIASGDNDAEARRRLAYALEAAGAGAAAIIDAWRDLLAIESEDSEAHERLAFQLYECGQWADAVPHLRRAVASKPADPETRLKLARALDAAGDASEQISAWRDVLELDESNVSAHRRLAALFEASEPAAALNHLDFLAKEDPDDFALWRRIAVASRTAGDDACEKRAWLKIIAAHAGDLEAHRRLSEIYLSAGNLTEAARHLESWVKERNRDQGAWITLAQVRERLEDIEGALSAWRRAAALGPLDAKTNVKIGQLFCAAGRSKEAVPFFEAALETEGDSAPLLRKLARTCRTAKMDRAEIDAWRRLLAIQPDDVMAHRRLGDLLRGLEDYAGAAPHLKCASEAAPNNRRLARRLVRACAESGDVDGEIAGWRRILDQDPDDVEAHARLGDLLYKRKKLKEAAPHLKRASDVEPGNTKLAMRFARACRSAGDPAGEICALERVIERKPDDLTARRRLSALYETENDTNRAIVHLEFVLAEKPEQASLWRRMAALRRAANDSEGEIAALNALSLLEPDNARVHSRCGLLLFKRRADGEAARHLDAAARTAPEDLSLRRKLARCYRNTGDAAREAETLEEILERDSGDLGSRRRLATILPALRRSDDALEHLGACVRLAPDNESDQRAFAEALSAAPDRHKEAAAAWARLLELAPGDRSARLRLAELYMQDERFEDAEKLYETLTESFPDDAAIWKKRAQAARARLGPKEEADILRAAVAAAPEAGSLLYALAGLLIDQNADDALETAQAAWKALPEPARYGALCKKLVQARRTDAAVSGYAMLVREAPDSPVGWGGLGEIMMRTEHYRRASCYFSKAYAITGTNADCKRWMGSLLRGGQFETINANRVVVEDLRNNKIMLGQYAQALAKLGRYEEAHELATTHYWPAEEILRDGFLHYLKVRMGAQNDGDTEITASSGEKMFREAEDLQAHGELRAAARLYAKGGASLRRQFAYRSEDGVDVTGPDFLIIGAPRSGSSWLKNCLKRHPQLRVANGEPSYFTAYVHYSPAIYSKWLATIKHARPDTEDGIDGSAPIFGEKTPEYLTMSDETIELCAALYPNVRLICVARDPVERAWSHLKHRKLAARDARFYKDDNGALSDWFLKILEYGCYARNLKRWMKRFPPEQFFIADFNRISDEPLNLLDDVQAFLGADRVSFSNLSFNTQNLVGATAAGGPPPEVEQMLTDFYSAEPFDVGELQRAVGAPSAVRPKSSEAA